MNADYSARIEKLGSLKRLRVADASCFPVGITQDEMINQMRKRLAIDCYPQFATVRKVRLAQLARPMLLGKEHLPRRPFRRPPVTDPAPQCPYLPVTESAWMRLLKMLKQRLRL